VYYPDWGEYVEWCVFDDLAYHRAIYVELGHWYGRAGPFGEHLLDYVRYGK
jgi:hypothetical protein